MHRGILTRVAITVAITAMLLLASALPALAGVVLTGAD